MVTEVQKNIKKRDRGNYFKEYRQRKKLLNLIHLIPNLEKENVKVTKRKNPILEVVLLGFVCTCLTFYLIFLSASYFKGNRILSLGIAALSELILILLVVINVKATFEKFIKYCLLIGMSLYSLTPIIMLPLQAEISKVEIKNQFDSRIKSIVSEIQTRRDLVNSLKEKGRITASMVELNKIAQLETELRNTTVHPVITDGAHQVELNAPAWVLVIQRVLLLLCNLFLTHMLFNKIKEFDELKESIFAPGAESKNLSSQLYFQQ